MRQSGVLVDVQARVAFESNAVITGSNELLHIGGCHSGMKRLRHGAVDEESSATGEAHTVEFVRALDHPATGRDGSGGDEPQVRVGGANAFREDKGHMLVETDGAGGEAPGFESVAEKSKRAFILLPGEDVAVAGQRTGGEKLVRAAFLERRAYEEGFGFRGEDESPQAFATEEMEIGEVDRGTGGVGENDGVDSVLDHQFAGALNASFAFRIGEGASLAGEIGEGLDC